MSVRCYLPGRFTDQDLLISAKKKTVKYFARGPAPENDNLKTGKELWDVAS